MVSFDLVSPGDDYLAVHHYDELEESVGAPRVGSVIDMAGLRVRQLGLPST